MDLRSCSLSAKDNERAAEVLNYQPFIISDDIQTGVAYSWFHSDDPRVVPPLVFRKSEYADRWEQVVQTNQKLRELYDGCIREIANRYPGGTLFDIACNNGYFPVQAELMGIAPSAGMDAGQQHGDSIRFLNSVLGTHASFIHGVYDTATHKAPIKGQYDVVVASAIMCHLPDPTHFLSYLGSIARKAVFFWGQIVDTDIPMVAYNPPHNALDLRQGATPFPHCFNDNTRMSRGLIELSFRLMGFNTIEYLPTNILNAAGPTDLKTELVQQGSKHCAILARRDS